MTTGSSSCTPSLRPAATTIAWAYAPAGARDHGCGDSVVPLGERRPGEVPQETPQPHVLLGRQLVAHDLLPQRVVLLLEALGVRAGTEEAVEPRPGVTERLGDPVGSDLERPERGGTGVLRTRQRPVGSLERQRHEDEGDEDQTTDDQPAPKRGGRPRGGLPGCGTLDAGAQHRGACGAVARHSGPVYRAPWPENVRFP